MPTYFRQRKIAVMGYPTVGKSSLTSRFVEDRFEEVYEPTISYMYTKKMRLRNKEYDVKLVDTAGQDYYSLFPYQYSVDVHGFVLVYSVTSASSFEVVKMIREKLLDAIGPDHPPLILVGNKSDLRRKRAVSTAEGKLLASRWNALFLETSAKENRAVDTMFRAILVEIERSNGNLGRRKQRCTIS